MDFLDIALAEHRRLKWFAADFKLDLMRRHFTGKYDPSQPRVPAGSPDGGQWERSDSIAGNQLFTPAARRISPAREAECEEMRRRDEIQCRFVGLRACWAQAYLRYGNCLAGLPIPPLNY
jgi:hypothetical protein